MKHQALMSSKDNSKNLKCRLLQFLFRALRVKDLRDHIDARQFKIQGGGLKVSRFQ